MASWWEKNLAGLSEPVAKERRRILKLLEAHGASFAEVGAVQLHSRLMNSISAGLDLDEEMKRPIEDRALGFDWPDG